MSMKVALLGCGVVGSEVVRLVNEQSEELAARIGTPIEIGGIAVRRLDRDRGVDPALLTTDATALVTRPDIDVVVEVIGGIEPARSLILSAIKSGKSVVTANKALLAEDGQTLHAAAREAGVDLYYEASVAGAIPLLRPLRDSLAGDKVNRVLGIVNGTTNYVLDRMDSAGSSFTEALEEAQTLGYAEADPTADVEGFDAAAKAAILARLAFHTQRVTAADVHREGITAVSAGDIASARDMGCVVKLLAICQRSEDGESVGVRVHPVMLPLEHPLASVKEAYNAVFVEAESAGRLMFYGAGAGGTPTAGAVLGDIVGVTRNRMARTSVSEGGHDTGLPVHDMGRTITSYHVALDVADRPGVLSQVAEVFADHGVSIKNVRQEGSGDDAQLVLVSHPAPDSALSSTVERLDSHPMVREVASVMRVETFQD
ncbi:MAG TPA: homoserine dehydrogenase [Nocardiopsis listeri]|uniref:homoserine dehydrogenase n=1 Tax=Nocardiopsis listeri TaxID=53440 RepID=UPI001DF8EAC9|nr:homoserine dehydrogenase [Nocardiopsis listeri]HJE57822.1 homoserine dehydrogenase [Nocardiopsis listeri]